MIDSYLSIVIGISAIILVLGLLFRYWGQPVIIAYIFAGILIGPSGFGIVTDQELMSVIGEVGVIMLLFFIGMEISLPKLLRNWRVAIVGTGATILLSIGIASLAGYALGWPFARSLLIGFVISISSTALLVKVLGEKKLFGTRVGDNVLGILLVQDVAVIPMMIIISFMGGSNESLTHIIPELLIGVVLIALFVWVSRHPDFKVPCAVRIRKDHDLRIFAALVICLGLAFLTSFFGLSASLGAFIAGILVANGKETKWVENSLHSFHILFVAIFFVSIGMLIDISFVLEHLAVILGAVFLVFFINTFVKGIVLKLLGDTWSESFYSGALLSQIGEFSFVLGAAALHTGIITLVGYQYVIAIISISLVLSPFWIQIFKKNMDVVERLHGSMYRW